MDIFDERKNPDLGRGVVENIEFSAPPFAELFKIPYVPRYKISVSGGVGESREEKSQPSHNRAVVIVVDTSGSMGGSRIKRVQQALTKILQLHHGNKAVVIRVITFNSYGNVLPSPKSANLIPTFIRSNICAGGGTSFVAATSCLVGELRNLSKTHSGYQQSVIFCTDGQSHDWSAAHKQWRVYIDGLGDQGPFFATIGIDSGHDSDVLTGFITQQDNGSYAKTLNGTELTEAFSNAMGAVSQKRKTVTITFPVPVSKDSRSHDTAVTFDVVASENRFKFSGWILPEQEEKLMRVSCQVNGKAVEICCVDLSEDSPARQKEGQLDYYLAKLMSMANELRTTDMNALSHDGVKKLQNELADLSDTINPLLKTQLDENKEQIRLLAQEELSSLQFKEMVRLIKKIRGASGETSVTLAKKIGEVSQVLAELRSILQASQIGSQRSLEIRQRINELAFRKRVGKRAQNIQLTDEALRRRARRKKAIKPASEEDIRKAPTSEECFLSASNMREMVEDNDTLWIGGRVRREHGMALVAGDLINIEYVSPHPMSAEYFVAAMSSGVTAFPDPSREGINCLLIPLYGCEKHLEMAMGIIEEQLSFAACGQDDLFSMDFYMMLFATVGRMISQMCSSERGQVLTFQALQALYQITKRLKVYPFDDSDFRKNFNDKAEKISMLELSHARLRRFITRPECRTSATVGNLNVLFADLALAQLSLRYDQDTNIEKGVLNAPKFWDSLRFELLRRAAGRLIPSVAANSVDYEAKHQQALINNDNAIRVLVQGLTGEEKLSEDDLQTIRNDLEVEEKFVSSTQFVVDMNKKRSSQDMAKYDPNRCWRSQMEIVEHAHHLVHWKSIVTAMKFLKSWNLVKAEYAGGEGDDISPAENEVIFSELEVDGSEISEGSEEKDGSPPGKWLDVFRDQAVNCSANFWCAKQLGAQESLEGLLESPVEISDPSDDLLQSEVPSSLEVDFMKMRAEIALVISACTNKKWQKCLAEGLLDKSPEEILEELNAEMVRKDVMEEEAKVEAEKKLAAQVAYLKALSAQSGKKAFIEVKWRLQRITGIKTVDEKKTLAIVVVGPRHSGKSTMLGHLIHLSGKVSSDLLDEFEEESKALKQESRKFAWVTDKHKDERQGGYSVDNMSVPLETTKYYTCLLNTPGHNDYLKNMSTVTAYADHGIVVLSATAKFFEYDMSKDGQLRDQLSVISYMGARNLVVCVNQMDDHTVNYSEERFEEIKTSLTKLITKSGFKVKRIQFVPICAFNGDNLMSLSPKMSWYAGPTLVDAIDNLKAPKRDVRSPFRMSVIRCHYRNDGTTIVIGVVASGTVKHGDAVHIAPNNLTCKVLSIQTYDQFMNEATAGDSIGIRLSAGSKSVTHGSVIGQADRPLTKTKSFVAYIALTKPPKVVKPGYGMLITVHTKYVHCKITRIVRQDPPKEGSWYGEVELTAVVPIYVETYSDCKSLGRLSIFQTGNNMRIKLIGAGKITGVTHA